MIKSPGKPIGTAIYFSTTPGSGVPESGHFWRGGNTLRDVAKSRGQHGSGRVGENIDHGSTESVQKKNPPLRLGCVFYLNLRKKKTKRRGLASNAHSHHEFARPILKWEALVVPKLNCPQIPF